MPIITDILPNLPLTFEDLVPGGNRSQADALEQILSLLDNVDIDWPDDGPALADILSFLNDPASVLQGNLAGDVSALGDNVLEQILALLGNPGADWAGGLPELGTDMLAQVLALLADQGGGWPEGLPVPDAETLARLLTYLGDPSAGWPGGAPLSGEDVLERILAALDDPDAGWPEGLPVPDAEVIEQVLAFLEDPYSVWPEGIPAPEDIGALQEQVQEILAQVTDLTQDYETGELTVESIVAALDGTLLEARFGPEWEATLTELVSWAEGLDWTIGAIEELAEIEGPEQWAVWLRDVIEDALDEGAEQDTDGTGTGTGTGQDDTVDPKAAMRLQGTADDDEIAGRAGDDSLFGMAGNDRIQGRGGDDKLSGGRDDDLLLGGGGNDRLNGQGGVDELRGASGNDVLIGGAGDDLLLGGKGDDRLNGQAGDDDLRGGAGDDLLIGGTGLDSMRGNAGADDFRYLSVEDSTTAQGADRIYGFATGEDEIDLSALAGDWTLEIGGPLPGGGVATVATWESNGNTIVNADVDGDGAIDMKIVVVNTTGLSADDFIL